jgi:hypothetical protein
MRFGMHLRELLSLRVGVAVSVLLAAFAAVWSVANISLLPPGLHARALDMASAEAQVVVDTPYSAVLDLRQDTRDIEPLKNRAVLIGTLMGSAAVRADIARRAGVPAERLQIVAPRTPEQPRPIEQSGHKKSTSDLLKSTDQYRLDVQTNPTVPLLTIDAQAPTAEAAQRLANASVTGLGDYLAGLASSEKTRKQMSVTLRQLGTAKGTVINHGVKLQVVLVVFSLVFALSCAATVLIARVARGWQRAGVSETLTERSISSS